jgi:hypothetical protein
MTTLIQQRTFTVRLPRALIIVGSVIVGLALLMLIVLIGALVAPWDLTNPALPYAPGAPDLQRSVA